MVRAARTKISFIANFLVYIFLVERFGHSRTKNQQVLLYLEDQAIPIVKVSYKSLKGAGGVLVENEVLSDFESFSYVLPETFYGIKKAFSVVMQWRDKVGTYAHFFRKMCGKISKNFDFFLPDNIIFWFQIIFKPNFWHGGSI